MIVERRSRCNICGKEIITKGNWFNQMFINQINDWTLEIHMRRFHKKRCMYWWYYPVSVLEILAGSLLAIIMAVLWIITLPFWVIHEFCSQY